MKTPDALSFDRRLRLLIATEFASRGYYLDAEGMFAEARGEALTVDELELLAKIAANRGDWHAAELRFKNLAAACGDSDQRQRFERLAVTAGEQQEGWRYRMKRLLGRV